LGKPDGFELEDEVEDMIEGENWVEVDKGNEGLDPELEMEEVANTLAEWAASVCDNWRTRENKKKNEKRGRRENVQMKQEARNGSLPNLATAKNL
jgi:hypothetical protein